jgi:thiosulfate/3-mercaptopyruvate sulfurtransferase
MRPSRLVAQAVRPALVAIAGIAIATSISPGPAAAAQPGLLVSPAWLAAHVDDPDLVVLHVGAARDFESGHVRGARLVTLGDLSRMNDGLRLEMLPPVELHDRLAALGISDTSRVVVYHSGNQLTAATRIMFTLDWAGLGGRSSLLAGGLGAWTDAGHAVTTDVHAVVPGRLAPISPRPLIVDAATVVERLKASTIAVIDGRTADFYSGARTGGSAEAPHRAGHIAGAGTVPYSDLLAGQAFKSIDELRALFAAAGVTEGRAVIGYCHIGQQATAVLFAARLLGHEVQLYDGSFEDWSRRTELAVVRSP